MKLWCIIEEDNMRKLLMTAVVIALVATACSPNEMKENLESVTANETLEPESTNGTMSITSPAAAIEAEVPGGPQKKVQLETDNTVTEDVNQTHTIPPPTAPIPTAPPPPPAPPATPSGPVKFIFSPF